MEKSIYSEKNKLLLEWLVSKRHEANLSQRKLATKLDLHHSIVGKIETGERRLDVIEYVNYCHALGANPVDGIKFIK